MKHAYAILALLFSLSYTAAHAQGDTTITFYDYWWKKCDKDVSHYYRIKYKDGNWWHTRDYYIQQNILQKEVTYSDDSLQVKQGMTYYFHPNGRLQKKVRYLDDKMEGMVKEYNADGRLIDSGLYKHGIPYKTRIKWDDKGNVIFKGVYDESGYGVGDETEYFEDGKLSSHGITREGFKRDSIWTFYTHEGIVSCQDLYDNGGRVGRMCYDKNGTLYTGTCDDQPAQFVEKSETINTRFSQRYGAMKESNYKISNTSSQSGLADDAGISQSGTYDANFKFKKGTVIVLRMYVDEKGKMTNIEVVHKIHPQVDRMVIEIFDNISKFKPATNGNRPVKASFDFPMPLDQL